MRQDSTEATASLTFEQIRRRAYELWERNHQPMGFEIEFWLMAEKELRAERNRAGRADAEAPRGNTRPAQS
ncbi:DUF2934 domain-containing protein [Methylobacterium sp. 77]|uniref:DUF2934 domain-containing protein n=1 Tax=Methylobacterium sp. 77 TaxID=1101192 RepID=UPI000375C636|nr:DUF2934 domain-containing protein [Methylobacterium sp. 77]